jgi:2-keto-4-pentenoate hydratase
MMNPSQFAQALVTAHKTGERINPPLTVLTRDEILWIQSEVCKALGPVAGFKVGVAGGRPILSPIPAVYLTQNGADRVVRDRLGIELEVGFELTNPLPAEGLPPNPQDYFRPLVALELVEPRLTGAAADDPLFKFADFQINSGLVIGDGPPNWDGSDFGTVSARLTAGETTILDGPATIPGGSALSNLDVLLRHLGDHCGGLQVGQIVITGSICGLPWFTSGTDVCGWIDGLGDVAISLT